MRRFFPYFLTITVLASNAGATEPLEALQWGIRNTGLPQKLAIDDLTTVEVPGVTGEDTGIDGAPSEDFNASKILVAILDTGIDGTHPEFRDRIRLADTSGAKTDSKDESGHGTHVAGIIGAATNGIGIRGVAANVELLPIKVIQTSSSAGSTFADTVARGMFRAIGENAKIINLSLAWPPGADSPLMQQATALALSRGILVVASAGNDSNHARALPCAYPGVICVAAHGPDGSLTHFTNYGPFVDIAAPGISILSTWPIEKRAVNFTAFAGYEYRNGTSMATPFVSGLLARLLGAGFSSEEAFARLIIGARQSRSSLKFTRSGNADLAASFAASPQPLILAAKKATVRPSWNGEIHKPLPISFKLRNFWKQANRVRLEARVVSADTGKIAAGVRLTKIYWETGLWQSGQEQDFSTALAHERMSFDGRLLIELTIQADDFAVRLERIPVEVALTISSATKGTDIERITIEGQISANAILRSVTALDGDEAQDFIAIETRDGSLGLSLIAQDRVDTPYRVAALAQLQGITTEPLLIQRLDADFDGASDYVFVFRVSPKAGQGMAGLRFIFLNRSLEPLNSFANGMLDHDNRGAVLAERFQWMKISVQSGSTLLVPAWTANGTTPEIEKPSFDPWNTKPKDIPKPRLYFLAPDGLRSVAAPDGFFFLHLLSQTQPGSGELSALLGKGEDYRLEYATVKVNGAKSADHTPLSLEKYRMLAGLSQVFDITPLDPGMPGVPSAIDTAGTGFAGNPAGGRQRVTLLVGDRAIDRVLAPSTNTDLVTYVTGAFVGGKREAIVAQLNYDLQYVDLKSGETTQISMDRFSYLPSAIRTRAFFPVVAESTETRERMPAILVPATHGASVGVSEVIVPVYEGDKLQGLARPARLRLTPGSECQSLGNPVPANQSSPARLVFICGNQTLIRVPLTY